VGPNGDPLSIVGDETWEDYAVAATVTFEQPTAAAAAADAARARPRAPPAPRAAPRGRRRPARPPVSAGASNAAVFAAPCNAADGAQRFAYDAATGEFSSAFGDGPGCLTTCGCTPACIQTYECAYGGCGGGDNSSYRWTLARGGALTVAPFPGLALAAYPLTGSVALEPAAPGAAAQTWTFNAATGAVAAPALGVCLSQLKPSATYGAVCGRVGAYDGFAPSTTPAYCIALYASGAWALLVNSAPIATGNATSAPFDPRAPHRLALSLAADNVDAYLNGALLASVVDGSFRAGNAAVGSGWHPAQFDDFEVTAPYKRPETV